MQYSNMKGESVAGVRRGEKRCDRKQLNMSWDRSDRGKSESNQIKSNTVMSIGNLRKQ